MLAPTFNDPQIDRGKGLSAQGALRIVDLGTTPPTVLTTLPIPGGGAFDVSVNRERGLVFVASGAGGLTVVVATPLANGLTISRRLTEASRSHGCRRRGSP